VAAGMASKKRPMQEETREAKETKVGAEVMGAETSSWDWCDGGSGTAEEGEA